MLNCVDATTGNCHTNNLLIVAFAEALLKFLIYNSFHSRVNFDFSVLVVNHFNPLLDVKVNTLVNESFGVGVLLTDVKSVT